MPWQWKTWWLLHKLEGRLIGLYRHFSQPPVPNLKSDRDIEYSWVAAHMPEGPGNALEFGVEGSWMGLLAARKGFDVVAIDLQPMQGLYVHSRLRFLQGDIFALGLPAQHFDFIINSSTIEHVGLAGRYGVCEHLPDGDLQAMTLLRSLLKPGKMMVLTIPVGPDRVCAPSHRVYGCNRLRRLLDGWEVGAREYWTKDDRNRWVLADERVALEWQSSDIVYALGLFVLRRPINDPDGKLT